MYRIIDKLSIKKFYAEALELNQTAVKHADIGHHGYLQHEDHLLPAAAEK